MVFNGINLFLFLLFYFHSFSKAKNLLSNLNFKWDKIYHIQHGIQESLENAEFEMEIVGTGIFSVWGIEFKEHQR